MLLRRGNCEAIVLSTALLRNLLASLGLRWTNARAGVLDE